jgi:hypothetical protein
MVVRRPFRSKIQKSGHFPVKFENADTGEWLKETLRSKNPFLTTEHPIHLNETTEKD